MPYAGMSNQKVWVSVSDGHRLSQPDDTASKGDGDRARFEPLTRVLVV